MTREEKLVEALTIIICARDSIADGEAPPFPETQGFDDWAADLAQRVLDESLEITISFALFETMQRQIDGCKAALKESN